jgi:hypothetical protein
MPKSSKVCPIWRINSLRGTENHTLLPLDKARRAISVAMTDLPDPVGQARRTLLWPLRKLSTTRSIMSA